MVNAIEVIYEEGVFKPLKRIDLPEGTRCVVIIEEDIDDVVAKVDELIKRKRITIKDDPLEILIGGRR